jgi:hypothetical protein
MQLNATTDPKLKPMSEMHLPLTYLDLSKKRASMEPESLA